MFWAVGSVAVCVGFEEGVEELSLRRFRYEKEMGISRAIRLEVDINLPRACFSIHSFHEKRLC